MTVRVTGGDETGACNTWAAGPQFGSGKAWIFSDHSCRLSLELLVVPQAA